MPQAASLASAIKNEFGIDVRLIEGHGGIFQVVVNGKTVFDNALMPGKPKPPVKNIFTEIRKRVS